MAMPKRTPKPKPKKLTDIQKREEIIKQHQKRISPAGIAAAEAAAKKAIEDKYPGLFIPETKISAPGRRGR
jgi:hypothetical protein